MHICSKPLAFTSAIIIMRAFTRAAGRRSPASAHLPFPVPAHMPLASAHLPLAVPALVPESWARRGRGPGTFLFLAGTSRFVAGTFSFFGWDLFIFGWDLYIFGWEPRSSPSLDPLPCHTFTHASFPLPSPSTSSSGASSAAPSSSPTSSPPSSSSSSSSSSSAVSVSDATASLLAPCSVTPWA